MASRNQRAGTDWEEACARDARAAGFTDAERAVVKHPDRGDLRGTPGWTLECKSPGPHVIHTPDASWARWARAHAVPVAGPSVPASVAGSLAADAFLAGFAAGQQATTRFDIAGAMDQLAKAQAETGTPYGAVLRKRPRATSARGYALMEMSQFWAIARRLASPSGSGM